ncbi:MAG: ABC transporter ATP-binding protein [Candidatus Lindowbacteria bacterium]|nr:ABC transporter ATP-binding protein [Candidatus Lindowbacteria bacterium]
MSNVLEVKDVVISALSPTGSIDLVEGVSFTLKAGEITALVGESGCGKSMTALALMGLLPPGVKMTSGEIWLNGDRICRSTEAQWQSIRGRRIAMIFQEPMTSLNPLISVGEQISEVFRLHFGDSKKEALKKSVEMLRKVKIPDPENRASQHPHQMSGGMRQRVMIAMALASNPDLLIADEPTTALDVTIQAQVLQLVREIVEDDPSNKTAVLLITHDMGVVSETAAKIIVMYAGLEVEVGSVKSVFSNPRHPYTRGLLEAIPKPHQDRLISIPGLVPRPGERPKGCGFAPRCSLVQPECKIERISIFEKGSGEEKILSRCIVD